jgi:hypothetical protein
LPSASSAYNRPATTKVVWPSVGGEPRLHGPVLGRSAATSFAAGPSLGGSELCATVPAVDVDVDADVDEEVAEMVVATAVSDVAGVCVEWLATPDPHAAISTVAPKIAHRRLLRRPLAADLIRRAPSSWTSSA